MRKTALLLLALLCAGQSYAQPAIMLIDSTKKSWMPDGKGTVGLRFRNAGNQPLIVSSASVRSSSTVFSLLTSFTSPKIVPPGDSSYVIVNVDAKIAFEYFAHIDLLSNDPKRSVASFALRVNDSVPPNPVRQLNATPLRDGYLAVNWTSPTASRDGDSISFFRAFVVTKNGESQEIYSGKGSSLNVKSKYEGDVYVTVLAYDDMGNRSVAIDTTYVDWSAPLVRLKTVDPQFSGIPRHIEIGQAQFGFTLRDKHLSSVDAFWREPGMTALFPISRKESFNPLKQDHIFTFDFNTSNLRGLKDLVLSATDAVGNTDTSVFQFNVSQARGWPKRMLNHPLASSVLIASDEGGRFIMTGADIANGVFRPEGHHYFYNWPHDLTRPLVDNMIVAAADFDDDRKSELAAISQSDKVLIMDHHGMAEKLFGEVTFKDRYVSIVHDGDSSFLLAGHSPIAVKNEAGSYTLFGGAQAWRLNGEPATLERTLTSDGVRERDRFVVGNLLSSTSEHIVHVHDNGIYEEFSIRNPFGKQEAGPFTIWQPSSSYLGCYPSLGDIDGDGDLEIIVPAANDSIYAFHHTGSAVSRYPVHVMSSTSGRNQAMLVDLNADGASEIILPVQDSIVAIDGKSGMMIHSSVWPIKREGPGTGLITVADANSDGYLELIDPPTPGDTGWVYVYDLGVKNEPGTIDWGTFQHDMMRTGNYNTPSEELLSSVRSIEKGRGVRLAGRTLRLDSVHDVEVVDILGRQLFEAKGVETVELGQLDGGVYFVIIDELQVIKIVL